MNPKDDVIAQILASIAALPPEEQSEAVQALVGSVLKDMPVDAIHAIRDDIASQLSMEIPLVRATLEMIDGQLALREIGGRADWR